MAALTAPRNTPRLGEQAVNAQFAIPVKASTLIQQGALVVFDAGYAAPGRTATGLVAAGVATQTVDNSTGAAGALSVNVRRGMFRFNNSASADLIAQANCGGTCYIVDDNTVALTSATSTRSTAGKVVAVDSAGVWVEVY